MTKDKSSKEKVQKNVELVSLIASQIEEMGVGERVRVTPFAHSIQLGSGSHPHVETVKGKLSEAFLWQDITRKVKFLKDRKSGEVMEIERIEEEKNTDVDLLIKKELRTDLEVLKNKTDLIERNLKTLTKENSESLNTIKNELKTIQEKLKKGEDEKKG